MKSGFVRVKVRPDIQVTALETINAIDPDGDRAIVFVNEATGQPLMALKMAMVDDLIVVLRRAQASNLQEDN